MTPSIKARKWNAWLLYAGGVGAFALLFKFWQVEPVPANAFVAGVLLWALSLFPLLRWYDRGHWGFPMFELICLAYGLAYSIPVFLAPHHILIASEELALPWETVTPTVLLACLGVGAVIAGYYLTRGGLRSVRLPRLDLPLKPGLHDGYIYFALAFGFGIKVLGNFAPSLNQRYSAILNLFASQFSIGLIVLCYRVFSRRKPPLFQVVLLYGSVAAGSLFGLTGGMVEGVLLPMVTVLIVRWHVRHKFPLALGVFIALVYLGLNPLKAEYRRRVWFGEEAGMGMVESLHVWVDVARDFAANRQSETAGLEERNNFQDSIDRIDLLHKFAYVRTMTPAEVPYFRGLTYRYLVYTFIPRLFWPGKPVANEATDMVDFAYKFRLPNQDYHGTNIAIGQLAEAFANFGVPGIFLVMLLQGVIFALLNKVLNGPHSVVGRAIYLTVMIAFLNGIGTSAVILFGSIIQFVIASAVLVRPFATGFSARRKPPPPKRPGGPPRTPGPSRQPA